MRQPARRTRDLLVALVATVVACEASDETQPDFSAPPAIDATLILEPPILHIGEVVGVEIVVVTPPQHSLQPIVPQPVEGLSLLSVQALAPDTGSAREIDNQRWTHRVHFRVRAESVGPKQWPETRVEVVDATGSLHTIQLPARSFEVASVRDRFPERDQPFGLEEPPREDAGMGGFGFGLGLGLGVALGLAIALGVWLARQTRIVRNQRLPASETTPPRDLFEWTDRELEEAIAALGADPHRAASAGAHLLRVYMDRRFGSDTHAATTEELDRHEPALAERSSWPDFVRILRSFDDERFRPSPGDGGTPHAPRVRAALEDSRRLVEASRPPGATGGLGGRMDPGVADG
jgi:hypothetical protein